MGVGFEEGQDEVSKNSVAEAVDNIPISPEPRTPWSEVVEAPIPNLAEGLATLRAAEIGKPLMIGERNEDGQPTPDSKFVGLILPYSGDNWHVMLLDNGMAAVLGKQHSWGTEQYDDLTQGLEPKYFSPDMTKAQIFDRIAHHPRDFGSGEYARSDDIATPNKKRDLEGPIKSAIEKAGQVMAERKKGTEELGNYTAGLIDTTLSGVR